MLVRVLRPLSAAVVVAAGSSLIAIPQSHAGGFIKSSSGMSYAAGVSQTGVSVKNAHVAYNSRTYVNTDTKSYYKGQILEANALAGNTTEFAVKGEAYYSQSKYAKAKVYAKGGSIMAKGHSENCTTIYVAGKAYIVAKEVAIAMARHTPIGTSAAAESHATLDIVSNGYVGGTTSSVNRATVRVAN